MKVPVLYEWRDYFFNLFLRMIRFVDAFLNLANLLGDRDFLRTDLRTLPHRLTTPCPILVIQEGHPFIWSFIPWIEEIPKGPYKGSRPDIGLRLFILIDGTRSSTAGAEDTPECLFKQALLLRGLSSLLIWRRSSWDQIRLDRIIFLKEGIKVHNQVFNHLEHREGFDENLLPKIFN